MPGGTIYYAMKSFVLGNMTEFSEKMVYMIKIGGAIALGIALAHAAFMILVRIYNTLKERRVINENR